MRTARLSLVTASFAVGVGCDYSGDFLFPQDVGEVPAVQHYAEVITPAVIAAPEDLAAAIRYGQLAPTGDARPGGMTYSFLGTGGSVCLFVDPEVVTWNQSVNPRGIPRWKYPDNIRDDGDLDLEAGLGIYYDGTPGEEIGGFAIRYDDSLGNPVSISLNECVIPNSIQGLPTGGHAGRASPEWCTLFNTQPGATYIVKMETWSTPLDDDRLGFGFIVADGSCVHMFEAIGTAADDEGVECIITGEAIDPVVAAGPGPWTLDDVPSESGSLPIEASFCAGERMATVCETEATENDCVTDPDLCFCGDPSETPTPGAF